jgi:polyisoprenoid-binding protein YceI
VKTIRLAAAAALSVGVCVAADYTLPFTPASTKISWTLSDPLHTVRGTFNLKRGEIRFDPETGKASGEVVVDVASGESGSGARDSKMHSSVLESAKYPEAVFTPDRIDGKLAMTGASHVQVHGTFRIHGAEHEITMNADVKVADRKMDVHITFDVPYVAWGMKDPSNFLLRVGKTVQVTIEAGGLAVPR